MFRDIFSKSPQKEFDKTPLSLKPYGETNVGRKRSHNEDAILIFDASDLPNSELLHNVFAVADGVGGQPFGEVAANSLVSSIYKYASEAKYITDNTLISINREIDAGASTLVLAQQSRKDKNHYHVYSVGDSSALILDSRLQKMTEITRRDEDSQGIVTQAMGPDTGLARLRQPNQNSVHLEPGQTLILASDGFTRYIDKKQITTQQVLKYKRSYPQNSDFVKSLVDRTNALGGVDNITIISIPYQPK